MKRLLFIIFASIAILALFAQNGYYNVGANRKYLTVDSSTVVSFVSQDKNEPEAVPSHLVLVDSASRDGMIFSIYHVDLPKSKYNLKNLKYFPKNLSLTPCYRDIRGRLIIPNGYIGVRLKNEKDIEKLKDVASKIGLIIDGSPIMGSCYSLIVQPGKGLDPFKVANQLLETGLFDFVEPDIYIKDCLEISYDSLVHRQWGLYNKENPVYDISLSEAWNYATGRGIKIAIIDNGVDSSHVDLAKNMYKKSYDAETKTLHNRVYNDHATHCAGIAAGIRNNGRFISGVAPDAKIMSIRFNTKKCLFKSISSAINWAWKNGADVISCSWGLEDSNSTIELAIDSALTYGRNGKGCVFVKSAGNKERITFPGNYPGVITVANISKYGALADSCAHGANMFIAAPGTDILSTVCDNKVGIKSGTSMAAPHVAGVAALILQRNPDLTARDVRRILAQSADKIGTVGYTLRKEYGLWNEYYGYGLVNAAKAVKLTPRKE